MQQDSDENGDQLSYVTAVWDHKFVPRKGLCFLTQYSDEPQPLWEEAWRFIGYSANGEIEITKALLLYFRILNDQPLFDAMVEIHTPEFLEEKLNSTE